MNFNADLSLTRAIDNLEAKYGAFSAKDLKLEDVVPADDPDYQIILRARHRTTETFDNESKIDRIKKLMAIDTRIKFLAKNLECSESTISHLFSQRPDLVKLRRRYKHDYTRIIVVDSQSGRKKIYDTPHRAAKAMGIKTDRLKYLLTTRNNPPLVYEHLQAKRYLWYKLDGGLM